MKKQFSVIAMVLLVSFLFVSAAAASNGEGYSDKSVKGLFTKKNAEKPTQLVHFAAKKVEEVKVEAAPVVAPEVLPEVKPLCKCGMVDCKCGCVSGAPCMCEAKPADAKIGCGTSCTSCVSCAKSEVKKEKKAKKAKKGKKAKRAKKAKKAEAIEAPKTEVAPAAAEVTPEAPKVEAPKVEAPAAPEAPKVEAPVAPEAPKTETK